MRYGQIRQYDIANGEGIRTSIFVTGCTYCCYNCFNEEYQDFNAGKVWTQAETDLVVSYVKNPTCSGLTLLGGSHFKCTRLITGGESCSSSGARKEDLGLFRL